MMKKNMLTITYSLTEIDKVVIQFWKIAKKHPIIAFNGKMGAGKTTFISHLCKYLSIEETPSSPTFALINEYYSNKINKSIYHIDLYRLNSVIEAVNAGIEDCILNAALSKHYCFIEWAKKFEELLPETYLEVNLEMVNENERSIVINILSK